MNLYVIATETHLASSMDRILRGMLNSSAGAVLDLVRPTTGLFMVASPLARHILFDRMHARLDREMMTGVFFVLAPFTPDDISGSISPHLGHVWEWVRRAADEQDPARFPMRIEKR